MSRVPSVGEVVRILWFVNRLSRPFWFRVTRVVHNAIADGRPRRSGELDAWVDCAAINERGDDLIGDQETRGSE